MGIIQGEDNLVTLHIVKYGEKIITKDGLSRVKTLKKYKQKVSMFDLSVDSQLPPSYYANGILSHNTVSASIVILHYILFNDNKGVMIVANKGSTVVEILDKIKGSPIYIVNFSHLIINKIKKELVK